jgi:hypothetical protein
MGLVNLISLINHISLINLIIRMCLIKYLRVKGIMFLCLKNCPYVPMSKNMCLVICN